MPGPRTVLDNLPLKSRVQLFILAVCALIILCVIVRVWQDVALLSEYPRGRQWLVH
jgi:hypothetical protein